MVNGPSVAPFLDAFQIGTGAVVAIAGSGGKATLMYHLALEAVQWGLTVLTTSSTHLHPPTSRQSNGLFLTAETPDWQSRIPEALAARQHVTVVGARPRPDKLRGLTVEELTLLHSVCQPDVMIIKADGARTRPFKAPGPDEPVVPPWTTHGVVVVGIHSVGLSLDERTTHRPERVAELTGLRQGECLTEEAVACVASHPDTYSPAFPPHARLALYLGWVDTSERQAQAQRIADAVKPRVFSSVFCGSVDGNHSSITRL